MKNQKYEFLRNITRRKTNFTYLRDEQKLVIIAKDVKKALELGLISPTKGFYCYIDNNKILSHNNFAHACIKGSFGLFNYFNINRQITKYSYLNTPFYCNEKTQSLLNKVERYFEGWEEYNCNFGIDLKTLMNNICDNIIANKGKFTL